MSDAPDSAPKQKAQGTAKQAAASKVRKQGESASSGSANQQQGKQPESSTAGSSTQQPAGPTPSGSSTQQSSQGREPQSGGGADTESHAGPSGRLQADLDLTRTCEDLVDSFRRGQAQKGATLLALAAALRVGTHDQGVDGDAVETAFESYCAQVDEIAKYHDENRPNDSGEGTQPRGDTPEEDRGRPETLSKSKGKRRAHRSASRSPSKSRSRSRSTTRSSDEDEQPAKRQKQDPSLFAWASANSVAESSLRPELQETLKLLRNHEKDLKFAKASLRNLVGVPEFPEAEWTNVLLGKPVNLNHVLSGQYTLEQDEKHVEKFGLVELSYRTATPSKIVKNAGDWIIAWQRTTAATLYAFPHRRAELDGYYLHIFGLFSAIHASHHNCILDYDRRVRKRVAAMRTLLLTDTHEFADLRDQFINIFGASTSHASEESKKRAGSNRKPHDEEACYVPDSILNDPVINDTLRSRPDLFKIVTPIKIDVFENLLSDHPNPAFIASVVKGLREGFWPFADGRPDQYPDTWDEARPPLIDEHARQFLRDQRDEEIALGRYSPAFGSDLLPGMFSMPIHVVSKPHSDKLRLINNLSAGKYSLNGMIRPESIKGAVLDGLPALGHEYRKLKAAHPGEDIIFWKSDVSQAYHRMPMSPYWQIFQVVTIDGQRHVDRCNTFGGRASLRVWLAFYCCVAWIAVVKRRITSLVSYVDDNAGVQLCRLVQWYIAYGMYVPKDQCTLLILWDDLGLRHDRPKQIHGLREDYVGFEVDTTTSHATLPPDARHKLLDALEAFCAPTHGRRRTLAEFQSLAGYVNWALNVFPLLCPALSSLYAKIANKTRRFATIHVNNAIRQELSWMATHVRALPGIRILSTNVWSPADLSPGSLDDEFVMTDASGRGLGLYFPWQHLGFHATLPQDAPTGAIFFFEALAICAAIHKIPIWHRAGRIIRRIGILSNNTNAVSIFQSLRAEPLYNPILISAIDVLLTHGVEHRVDHVPGEYNVVADALSRGNLDVARAIDPLITILPFQPPTL
ncbi:hypothetical protein GSI_02942 [Ganoderma sinense ZZ0214-1]|uniref:Reverse transcriptase domain-containing protein n=1 Tax=Ganoderma sinense ZZ0214-1 TaxID=1077348 RepID=A0A2G8SN53_9APHY|nr:hypothetical protein GSI_02942 [Ganoderma sinense ZZ0214-1]